jgi:Peptidase family C25
MKKAFVIIILSMMSGFGVHAAVEHHYAFQRPGLDMVGMNLDGLPGEEPYCAVRLPDAPLAAEPGYPLIPHRPVTLLIPQGQCLDRVDIGCGEWIPVKEQVTLAPAQHAYPLSCPDEIQPVPPDPRIYAMASPYPAQLYSQPKVFWCKGYQIVTFNLFPVRYIPSAGRLSYVEFMDVTVQTRPGDKPSDTIGCRGLDADIEWIKRKVDNPRIADGYRPEHFVTSQILDSRDTFDYVIITTNAIAGMAGPNNYQDFLDFKASRGISGTIKPVEDIYIEYTGSDNQEKIRNFIIDAYSTWNTQWVLLGADVAGVPARGCYATAEGHEDSSIPTDMYYGCLDGSWDYSGNSVFGEMGDGPDGGDPDVYAEVYVGRAPVDSQTDLHNIVSKTITYETDDYTQEHADNALLLGEYLWPQTYGGDYMDELWYGCDLWGYSTPGYPPSWEIDNLYERESSWGSSDLRNELNANDTFWVNHLGHASESSVMHFGTSDVDGLTNSRPFLVYSQGCYAGAFDTGDCIAEHFSWADHAAFAVLMNGRYGWGEIGCTDGPSQYFHRQFHDAFFTEDIREIGKMNQDSKEDNVWCLDYKANRWVCYEMNLLGCPQTPIHGIITSRGSITFDRTAYGDGDTVMVSVTDVDLNLDPGIADTVNIALDVASGNDTETLELIETGPGTCIFQGNMGIDSSPYNPSNGHLDAQELDEILATYIDESDGFGGVNIPVTDTAVADYSDPVISNVQVTFIDTTAWVTWETDEMTDSRVVYDIASPPVMYDVTVDERVKNHTVTISGLDQCMEYYFYVISTDDAGNSVTDDNGGSYYDFTTMIRLYPLQENMDTDPGWTITGGDWEWGEPSGMPSGPGADPESGMDGPNIYGTNLNGAYAGGTAYHLITPSLNCSAALGTRLKFYRWLAVDEFEDDQATISISTDGSTWTTIYENPASNFYEYRWTEVSYDISEYADLEPQVYIRWSMAGGSGSVGGWNIDNVEVSYPSPCNVPILIHHTHEIDDSAGNNDGLINPLEDILMPVTLRNVGLAATNVSAVLSSEYPNLSIVTDTADFGNIDQGGQGTSGEPFGFNTTKSAADGDRILFNLDWTCDETSGSTSFVEEVVAPLITFNSVMIVDNFGGGDGDGIWDPGETVQLVVMIHNEGRLAATTVSGDLDSDQPAYVTLDDPAAEFPDIEPGGIEGCIEPYFTVTSDESTPDHTAVEITLALDSDTHSSVITFELDITTSTFARRYYWPMNSDPGWSTEGAWAFGIPQGNDLDPSSGYTGDNVYGYNLSGGYENNLPETSLMSDLINCGNLTSVEIRYMRWLGVESSQWDHASFEVSNDGTTWNIVWDHTESSFTDPDWVPQVFDISAYADAQPQVYLRWVMGPTDGSVTYCGWNLDDIEIYAEQDSPQPILEYAGHTIDDSEGNNDGQINPNETIQMDVSAYNYGIAGSGISGYLSSSNPHVSITQDYSAFPDIPAYGQGQTLTSYTFTVLPDAADGELLPFTITWTSDQGNGAFSFNEEIKSADLHISGVDVFDGDGDSDGVIDPGETVQLHVTLQNGGQVMAAEVSGVLMSDHGEYITLDDDSADFEDVPVGGMGGTLPPHFTITADPATPEDTVILFTVMIQSDVCQIEESFSLPVTSSTFTKRYEWNMDTDPGWQTSGLWAWGEPQGVDDDPDSGYTGENIYGYNLAGEYENNLGEMVLETAPIDCSYLESVEVRFMRWLGVEDAQYDHAAFEISMDRVTWHTIWEHTTDDLLDTSWQSEEYDVSQYADGELTVYFRWVMGTTDSSVTFYGWNIDDVQIWAESGEPLPTPTFMPPTQTPAPPTYTPLPPTATPVPPTDTPELPTETPVPSTHTPGSPTGTPVPPTATPPVPTITVTPTVPQPTFTVPPQPTDTPAPSFTATPSPTAMPDQGMVLTLEDRDLEEGDEFYLHFDLYNPDPQSFECDVYLLLGVYGHYWCWPEWCDIHEAIDYRRYRVGAESIHHEDVLQFFWPAGTGTASDLEFIGAVFMPDTWEIVGELQYLLWEYR